MTSPPQGPTEPEESVPIGWQLLSSGRTLSLLLAGLGLMVCLGTYIPQRVGIDALLERFGFASARALSALGLNDLPTAWPLQLITMLVLLTGIGLWLRTRQVRLQGAELSQSLSDRDPLERRVIERPLTEVQQSMSQAGWTVRWTSQGGVARRGLFDHGLVMIALAGIVFLSSVLIERVSGQRLRAHVVAHAGLQVGQTGQTEVEVWEGGQWTVRQLPFVMDCAETAIGLQNRGWNCELRRRDPQNAVGKEERQRVQIGRRWPASAFGYEFFLVREQPLPANREPMVLVDTSTEKPSPIGAFQSGVSTPISESEDTLTTFRGADGPMVVVTPKEGRPYLAAPRRSAKDRPATVGDTTLGFVPGWRVTFEAHRPAGTYLLLSALFLGLLGFGLCFLFPDLRVSLRPGEAGQRCIVEIHSFNRSRVKIAFLDELCGGGERS